MAQKANSLAYTKWLCKYRIAPRSSSSPPSSRSTPRCALPRAAPAHADLYDRMEQALCERVANAVEVVRSDISPAPLVHTGPNLVGVAVQGL